MRDHGPQRSGRERSDEMVTLNAPWGGALGSLRLLAAVVLLAWASSASAGGATAQPPILSDSAASDLPAGYIVFPKIVVHTTGAQAQPPVAVGGTVFDTLIQL